MYELDILSDSIISALIIHLKGRPRRKAGKGTPCETRVTAIMVLGFSKLLLNFSSVQHSVLGLGAQEQRRTGVAGGTGTMELVVQGGEAHIAQVILDLCGNVMTKEKENAVRAIGLGTPPL